MRTAVTIAPLLKVFRTYNASKTLQEQLELLTNRKHYLYLCITIRLCIPPL